MKIRGGALSLGACLTMLMSLWIGGAQAAPNEDDYARARWDPIHFKPAIDAATDAQCLACHQDVIEDRVRDLSPAGLKAGDALAWYQTLETYQGDQETFHRRHLVTDYARQVMRLQCNTCHQGNDPREETANSSATGQAQLTQRKQVDPKICLMCHGRFNYPAMGLPGDWPDNAQTFGNSCLTCHVAIRTERHKVNFLNPGAIEEAAKQTSDVCYGCHGGRAWYRINYPYPRHLWPGAGELIPDWAKDRPTESDPRFATTDAAR